jgi:hypothetical protein
MRRSRQANIGLSGEPLSYQFFYDRTNVYTQLQLRVRLKPALDEQTGSRTS